MSISLSLSLSFSLSLFYALILLFNLFEKRTIQFLKACAANRKLNLIKKKKISVKPKVRELSYHHHRRRRRRRLLLLSFLCFSFVLYLITYKLSGCKNVLRFITQMRTRQKKKHFSLLGCFYIPPSIFLF